MDRVEEFQQHVQNVLAKARQLYNIPLDVRVTFDLKGAIAGQARCKMCRQTGVTSDYHLRFNSDLIQGKHFDDMIHETIPHEIAHLVTYAEPRLGYKHDAGWRKICKALGGNGRTRHNMEVSYRGGSFVYRATCGTLVTVSKIMHNKIQKGSDRVLKSTGGLVNRFCAWALQGQPLPPVPQMRKITEITWPQFADPPVEQVAQPSVKPHVHVQPVVQTSKKGQLTWAEKVRQLIKAHKPQGTSQHTVIILAITNLGMTKERARSCVKAHWDKV